MSLSESFKDLAGSKLGSAIKVVGAATMLNVATPNFADADKQNAHSKKLAKAPPTLSAKPQVPAPTPLPATQPQTSGVTEREEIDISEAETEAYLLDKTKAHALSIEDQLPHPGFNMQRTFKTRILRVLRDGKKISETKERPYESFIFEASTGTSPDPNGTKLTFNLTCPENTTTNPNKLFANEKEFTDARGIKVIHDAKVIHQNGTAITLSIPVPSKKGRYIVPFSCVGNNDNSADFFVAIDARKWIIPEESKLKTAWSDKKLQPHAKGLIDLQLDQLNGEIIVTAEPKTEILLNGEYNNDSGSPDPGFKTGKEKELLVAGEIKAINPSASKFTALFKLPENDGRYLGQIKCGKEILRVIFKIQKRPAIASQVVKPPQIAPPKSDLKPRSWSGKAGVGYTPTFDSHGFQHGVKVHAGVEKQFSPRITANLNGHYNLLYGDTPIQVNGSTPINAQMHQHLVTGTVGAGLDLTPSSERAGVVLIAEAGGGVAILPEQDNNGVKVSKTSADPIAVANGGLKVRFLKDGVLSLKAIIGGIFGSKPGPKGQGSVSAEFKF